MNQSIEEILSTLVSFRTVRGQDEEFEKAINYIANFLSKRGMYVEQFLINHVPSLVASSRPDNHKKPIVMLGAHIDVVPGPADMFTLKREGDLLHGRGAFDLKFAIAAYMKLVDNLGERVKDYDFGIMITSDEEHGGTNGAGALLARGFQPKVAILPDAGDTPDAWKLELSAKGNYVTQITTQGTTTHGSRPWNGDNAIYKLIDLLAEIRELFKDQNAKTNSLSIDIIEGGEVYNQVPHEAKATLDMRCLTDADKIRLEKQLKAICKKYGAAVHELIEYSPACFTDINNTYVSQFLDCVDKVAAKGIIHSHSTGASDARHFSKFKIPCIVASPPGNGYHDPVEWVSEKGIHELCDVLEQYLQKVATFAKS